jgi:hypothetical protein
MSGQIERSWDCHAAFRRRSGPADFVRIWCVSCENPAGNPSVIMGLSMKSDSVNERAASTLSGRRVSGSCLCGAVEVEIDVPAFWAWHDHSAASRRAHGAAYATYIGCWRKHARVAKGRKSIARFEDAETESARSFCSRCGTPLLYERKRSPHMVNIPRALFTGRTGREPRYHVAIEELQDWTYTGQRLVPLKGYPGIVWERPKSRRRPHDVDDLEFLDRRVLSARAHIVR